MPKYSKKEQTRRDLLLLSMLLQQQQIDDLIDRTLGIPTVPSFGTILAPNDPGRAMTLDLLFDDEAMVSDLLALVSSSQ
ncbi:hypothetical protein PTTG_27839 [Puccinia triticina 1-1 BBBD Race 1]|uniref:Uncharacterized protein n=1 Tax=Puccinia triticina (isolate 1-1 / race 1 (BBBD)) TaxID=630390 RepID=A0A180GGL1_PUCT1|nr:hypothetical protein PTTG_27839 [Puccinia triticina 1-1 BBBD Race 1]WAR51674.1 hypothetical protein PtB15_1B110 [Puccinia triticina]